MAEKISLELFQQLKEQLMQIIKESEDNYLDNTEEVEERITKQYLNIQNKLLSYDLSDIPFESWEGIAIISDASHPADLSKTHANIDFALVEYGSNGNFRGCNVRNLAKLGRYLNAKDFDEKTIKNYPELFLSDTFSAEFKEKYYNGILTISNLASLSNIELEEIKAKDLKNHMDYQQYNGLLIEILGIDKVVKLYNYSQEEYDAINKLINMNSSFNYRLNNANEFTEFIEQFKTANISELKNVCFKFVRSQIINSVSWININDYPELFIKDNADIFLVNKDLPEEVKQRYFNRDLTIQDLLDYPLVFQNIPIDNFMDYGTYLVQFVSNNYGLGQFQELVQRHSDVFSHLSSENHFSQFSKYLKYHPDLEKAFISAVKEYFIDYSRTELVKSSDGVYNVPDWLKSMNFHFVDKLNTNDDLLQYNDSVFILDNDQRMLIDTFNINNILKFEQETSFFTHKDYEWSRNLDMFNTFSYFFHINMFHTNNRYFLKKEGIDFQDGNLSYPEFLTQLAKCLDYMRKNDMFLTFPDYDWIKGSFRDNYPEIFMDLDAPKELKDAFYKNKITPEFLHHHPDFIKYLIDKNLTNTINCNIKLTLSEDNQDQPLSNNFIYEYTSRYGNWKFLQLCIKYGAIMTALNISSLHGEIEDEQAIEKALRDAIYNKIIQDKIDYSYLQKIPELVSEHPEMFVNFDSLTNISSVEKQRLKMVFYGGCLTFNDIKKYPELVDILKDKNLFIAFGIKDGKHFNGRILIDSGYDSLVDQKYSDLELLEVFGNKSFLELCTKYGRYMDGIEQQLNAEVTLINGKYLDINNKKILTIDDISKRIEDIIARECKLGNISYYPDDAPSFVKEKYPELFLNDNAPEDLKQVFYNYNGYLMTFKVLQNHKEWLPYLKDKALITSLLRNINLKQDLVKFIELFGEEKVIKLGINKAETVTEMLKAHQVSLMKNWYDKTGGKFIPDFVVMQNFNINDADKFLVSGSNWSTLMRIKNFAKTPEARDAMLKLAYCFGVFDHDQRGLKKLLDLLTSLPRNVSFEYAYIINKLIMNDYSEASQGYQEYTQLKEMLVSEGFQGNLEENIFSQIYRKTGDSYTLTINPQSYPKSSYLIRSILEKYPDFPILTPNKAHQLFGAFELTYDPDFREFLLANMNKILDSPEYISYISSIQRQFSDIKAMNSNRTLTLELAVSFVQTNKFTSVNVGNERVAEISAIAGYNQADFDMLQQIYNYGKQRTFSSIPRIEHRTVKTSGKYTYETLRLDDPLAMAIGTLTDCCQELHDSAEVCMEHSMVDKNGRVFVIKDDNDNIVAQSWVWRNKDVLCFDNIEIPAKAFVRATKEHPELGRKGFTDEVFEIYKEAAHDLIIKDDEEYTKLLQMGKITKEQYEGLRLGKVTVGLGYNDIAESLKEHAILNKGSVARPLPFEEPVKLSRALYTNDSTTQYILEERDNRREYNGATLPIHSDSYIEYTDANFTKKLLLMLEKLEIVTKEHPNYLTTSISDYADEDHIVTELAKNYGLNPDTTKIIMNPNFAIIYDINGNKLKIGDLLFNTKIDNGKQQMDMEYQVIMQMRLALEQVVGDKIIDVSDLDAKQLEMYTKIMELTNEMDIERGIDHER